MDQTINITANAAALAIICKEASEMTWQDKRTREEVVKVCNEVKRKCAKIGIRVEMGDGK